MPNDFMQSLLGPTGPVNTFARMWTPGVQNLTPSPADDPFYMNVWQSLVAGPQPQAPSPYGIQYPQQMAAQYGDAPTAASTIGVKSQKANKIRKTKAVK